MAKTAKKAAAREDLTERFMIRCSKSERAAWDAAAAADDRTTSAWLRMLANKAVRS